MKRHVCIIDDDDDVRDVLSYALEEEGFRVSSYTNPEEALEELDEKENLPGFIVADYYMPRMDGVTFINKLRAEYAETLGKIPCALSSANGTFDKEIPKGVIEIKKPMDLDVFLDLVRDHCI